MNTKFILFGLQKIADQVQQKPMSYGQFVKRQQQNKQNDNGLPHINIPVQSQEDILENVARKVMRNMPE